MHKTFIKGIFKDIRRSLGRFCSIIAIIALGVGFMVGIMAATPTLKKSYDAFYRDYLTADLTYKYFPGLDRAEVEDSLLKSGIKMEVATGKISDQTISTADGIRYRGRVYNLPAETISRTAELVDGRFPVNPNEAVAVIGTKKLSDLALGTLISSSSETLADAYLENGVFYSNVKIVGTVRSPLYISKDSEPSYVSAGSLETVVFMPLAQDAQTVTDVLIRLPDLAAENRFSKKYFDRLSEYQNAISAVLDPLAAKRSAELRTLLDSPQAQLILGKDQVEIYRQMVPDSFQVLTLKANASYVYLEANADKVDKIVAVFPPFFFFVAALVALTSVTRLVEEDRTLIGTYKGLGYTKRQISTKYLAYGDLSSLAGALLGLAGGIFALPLIIFNAFGTNFVLPGFRLDFNLIGSLLTFFLAIVLTVAVSFGAAWSALRESPARLMTPKAPKPGTRILLERLPFIWKHLKFKGKATMRNLFRYKKHLIMTVLGIFGSTSLLFAGFALRDSLSALSTVTYGQLRHYQLACEGAVDSDEFKDFFTDRAGVTYYAYSSYMVEFSSKNKTVAAELVVIPDGDSAAFSEYFTVRDEKTKKLCEIGPGSYVVSAQIADEFDCPSGHRAQFVYSGNSLDFTVTGVSENYLDNYVFMSRSSFAELFGFPAVISKALVKCPPTAAEALIGEFERLNGITSVLSEEANRDSYESLLSSIQMIDWVLIVAALVLAVVIVYNITTVSISERKRELATLKVLGYSSVETAGYVMRVIFVLSLFGIAFGILGGYLLTSFVVVSTESIGIRFGRTIYAPTYILTIVLMLVFIGLVDLIMLPKIKKINPAESLKSIE